VISDGRTLHTEGEMDLASRLWNGKVFELRPGRKKAAAAKDRHPQGRGDAQRLRVRLKPGLRADTPAS